MGAPALRIILTNLNPNDGFVASHLQNDSKWAYAPEKDKDTMNCSHTNTLKALILATALTVGPQKYLLNRLSSAIPKVEPPVTSIHDGKAKVDITTTGISIDDGDDKDAAATTDDDSGNPKV